MDVFLVKGLMPINVCAGTFIKALISSNTSAGIVSKSTLEMLFLQAILILSHMKNS